MSVVPTYDVIEVCLVDEIVAIEMIEESSQGEENSSCHQAQFKGELKGFLRFALFGRMVFVHDEHWHKDDGEDPKMHPEAKHSIREVFLDLIRLPDEYLFIYLLHGAHIAAAVPSNVEVPENGSKGHSDALDAAPDCKVDEDWVETVEPSDDVGCLQAALLVLALS